MVLHASSPGGPLGKHGLSNVPPPSMKWGPLVGGAAEVPQPLGSDGLASSHTPLPQCGPAGPTLGMNTKKCISGRRQNLSGEDQVVCEPSGYLGEGCVKGRQGADGGRGGICRTGNGNPKLPTMDSTPSKSEGPSWNPLETPPWDAPVSGLSVRIAGSGQCRAHAACAHPSKGHRHLKTRWRLSQRTDFRTGHHPQTAPESADRTPAQSLPWSP